MKATVLENKNIVLGVCGGIAAYKSVEVLRRLVKLGARVRVIMTKSAARFVGPMTFEVRTTGSNVKALVNGALALDATDAQIDTTPGYTNLYNLDGGFVAWEEAGYPLIHRDSD